MQGNLIAKVINNLRRLKQHPITAQFIKHNKRTFSALESCDDKKPIVLMEFNTMHSNIIAGSYLANVLGIENKAIIKAYSPKASRGLMQRANFKLLKFFGADAFGAYTSFGAKDFITIELDASQISKAKNLFTVVMEKLVDKRALECLVLDGIWVGDLIYDTYLREFNEPTIVIEDHIFQGFLLESLELFIFWQDFFENHDVSAVNVSHCAYTAAIPYRFAIENNIPAYQVTTNHLYRMSKSNYFAYNDFYYYRERFSNLPEDIKKLGLDKAKERIQRRFGGEVGVDMAYSTKSAWGSSNYDILLRKSSKKKILIATHCFFDSPHGNGISIFPDFYEWLKFLGKVSEVTDYDWYLKTHPDYRPETMDVLDDLMQKYPKLTLLPADSSHHQIIEEGIDVALTVYGTIGFEYAALGIPVISCSKNNPHIDYNFNIHPKDEEEYRDILHNLDSLEFEIDVEEVYEYYFMKHLNKEDDENLFFDDVHAIQAEIGGYKAMFTPAVYQKWLNEWTESKDESIISALRVFIQSGDFRMSRKHYEHVLPSISDGEKL
jgi:hypothetical protein